MCAAGRKCGWPGRRAISENSLGAKTQLQGGRFRLQVEVAVLEVNEQRVCRHAVRFDAESLLGFEVLAAPNASWEFADDLATGTS